MVSGSSTIRQEKREPVRRFYQSSTIPVKNLLNPSGKQGEIPDVSGQQLECKGIVNRPVPVHDNSPESSHPVNLLLQGQADKTIIQKVHKDVFVVPGNVECEIRLDDGADIKNILNGKFRSLVDTVFHKAGVTEFPRCCRQVLPHD